MRLSTAVGNNVKSGLDQYKVSDRSDFEVLSEKDLGPIRSITLLLELQENRRRKKIRTILFQRMKSYFILCNTPLGSSNYTFDHFETAKVPPSCVILSIITSHTSTTSFSLEEQSSVEKKKLRPPPNTFKPGYFPRGFNQREVAHLASTLRTGQTVAHCFRRSRLLCLPLLAVADDVIKITRAPTRAANFKFDHPGFHE